MHIDFDILYTYDTGVFYVLVWELCAGRGFRGHTTLWGVALPTLRLHLGPSWRLWASMQGSLREQRAPAPLAKTKK